MSVERRIRLLGMGLMVAGLVLLEGGPPLLQMAGVADLGPWVLTSDLARAVMLPLGAGLVAASLVVRAVTAGVTGGFVRTELAGAVALVGAGLLARAWGWSAAHELEQYLGPTGRAGALLAYAIVTVVAAVAVPLGVSLGAAWPVLRWLGGPESGRHVNER